MNRIRPNKLLKQSLSAPVVRCDTTQPNITIQRGRASLLAVCAVLVLVWTYGGGCNRVPVGAEEEPAQPISHGCCDAGVGGCDNASIESCVCNVDESCCSSEWDARCVGLIEALQCGPCEAPDHCAALGLYNDGLCGDCPLPDPDCDDPCHPMMPPAGGVCSSGTFASGRGCFRCPIEAGRCSSGSFEFCDGSCRTLPPECGLLLQPAPPPPDSPPPNMCGNGIVEPPEECDPPDGAACDGFCRITTILPPGNGGGDRSPGNPGDALPPGTGGGVIPDGQIVRRFEPDGTVYSITFSPQGTKVAIGTSDNVGIWDVATGTELLRVQHDVLETPVRAVAFSPDGSQFLTGGGSVLGAGTDAKLWDTNSGQLIRSFDHDGQVLTVKFSPQGALVMTGGQDEVAKIWNRATGELLNVFPHPTSEFFGINRVHVVAAPDSTFPILTISDEFAALWDPPSAPVTYATGVTATTGHLDDIISGAISPDGTIIATGSVDDTAKLWDVATGLLLHTLPHSGNVESIAFSPDGALLLTDAGWGTLWNVATGEKLHSFEADDFTLRASGVSFSQDGTHVLTAHDLDGAILWSVPNHLLGHGQPIPDAPGTDGDPPTGGPTPCGDECDFCVVGTLFEGQCPVEFLDNGICECGCQFVDSDCNSSVDPPPNGHACCQEGGPGCNDPAVEACVCSFDSFCCNEAWDDLCAGFVLAIGCDDCLGNGGVSPDVACGNGCDACWTGTTFENQCPADFDGNNSCDCGCQFVDSDCDAPSDSTPVCGNGTVEASEQCDPPGPACSDMCQSLTPQPSGAWFVINDSATGDECDTVQFTAAQAVILVDGSRFMFIDGVDEIVDGLTLSPSAELISGGQVIGFVEFAVGGSGQNMAWALNLDGKVLNGTLSSSPLRPDQVTVNGSSACNACQQVDAPPAGRCP